MGRLDGKVAIVTGAGRGIGAGIATLFAEEGARVVIATRTASYGLETASAIREAGGKALMVECDVADRAAVFAMVEQAVAAYGTIDLLISNAAVFPRAPVDELAPEDVDLCIDTNLKGPIWLAQACLPFLKRAQDGGRIVLISSIAGVRRGVPGYSAYGASKAGVNGLGVGLANELAPDGIAVNMIEPGTTVSASFLANFPTQEIRDATAAMIPMKRLVMPADIARACLFFCQPETSIVTGQILAVDGGISTGAAATPPAAEHSHNHMRR